MWARVTHGNIGALWIIMIPQKLKTWNPLKTGPSRILLIQKQSVTQPRILTINFKAIGIITKNSINSKAINLVTNLVPGRLPCLVVHPWQSGQVLLEGVLDLIHHALCLQHRDKKIHASNTFKNSKSQMN